MSEIYDAFSNPDFGLFAQNPNSIDTYHQKVALTLTERENDVYEAIKVIQPCTMHQVAAKMRVPLNTISGRFSGLERKDMIKKSGKTNDRKSLYSIK